MLDFKSLQKSPFGHFSNVGPSVGNIEIPLSFDDEQNAELDPVIINVRATLWHVHEISLTYVR